MQQQALQHALQHAQQLTLPLAADHGAEAIWQRVAERAAAWLDERGLALRDAILLLPFAQQLAPARRAWMRLGRWQPRIETTHSLAAALGPNFLAEAQQITFDPAIDALTAAGLLAQQSWAQGLRRRDERAFRLALTRLVECAHALARSAGQRAPAERDAFWDNAREQLAQTAGPGGIERALALVALEWAASDGRVPATDALFDMRPSAWIQVQAGGPDPLSRALLADADARGIATLCLVTDLDLDAPFDLSPPIGRLEQALCSDFEELAQCSAAAILQHLAAGRAPLALVAQDRVLVRRIRALLERQAVPLLDETGWTLATTPPAAQLMALLRAAAPQGSLDEWLAFLKTDLARDLRDRAGGGALALFESRCRADGWRTPQAVRIKRLTAASARLWEHAQAALHPLAGGARRSLADWLAALLETLQGLRADELLQEHEAGSKLLDALWLSRSPWPDSAHEHALRDNELRYAEFIVWVDETLEAQQYVPPAGADPQVFVTPLARAMLRPFGAIVLPGADAQTLGGGAKLPALLSDAQARAIGLPDLQQQRDALAFAFVQTLRAPALTLLRCTAHGAEPLAPSPLVERLSLALARAGHAPLAAWIDARPTRELVAAPRHRAAARAAGLLPASLSASSLDSLRNCPYQFFARVLLGLRTQDELETETDKRDYGTWLHAVLHRFHEERRAAAAPELGDEARLRAAAVAQMEALALPAAEFLPFSASFERFVPRYLAWLAETEAAGQRYTLGEQDRAITPFNDDPVLRGLVLRGRIDRIDGQGNTRLLIDYKTGGVAGLKDKVARPLEDTQLAVYAALVQADEPEQGDGTELRAQYLALDDGKGIAAVEHAEVSRSAAVLIAGVADDLRAAHGGAPLPALGEGMACTICEMRGLCRRDDWTEVAL